MGVVWRVRDRRDGGEYALKLPNYEFARRAGLRVEDVERILLQEAVHWRDLGAHPNIARLYEFSHKPVPYLKIEYVPGTTIEGAHVRSVRDLIRLYMRRGGRPPLGMVLRIITGAARGLAHAHERGLAHFDIKPENLLLDNEGNVKITDWGIAKPSGLAGVSFVSGLTPTYAAPEMRAPDAYAERGVRPGTWSDIYSLGAVLYELLHGAPPRPEDLRKPVPTLGDSSGEARAWAELEALARDMLKANPEERPTIGEVLGRLNDIRRKYSLG